MRVVQTGPTFHSTSQFPEVGNELILKVHPLVWKDFLQQSITDDEIVP